jgi:FKBP-type peptidyl-prolyl cis-trans isomerase SlpA
VAGELVTKGSRVRLHFTLSLAGGLVVDSTSGAEPLDIVVGRGDMAAGLEKYLLGLAAGERREVEIAPGEVHGSPDTQSVHCFARGEFPADLDPQPGQVVGFNAPDGEEVPGLVVAVSELEVQVDFSHPLAGHALIFEVEIVSIEPC